MNGEVVHRLGAVLGAALCVGWPVYRWGTVRQGRAVRRRLGSLLARDPVRAAGRRVGMPASARGWSAAMGVVGLGWVLVGGVAGVVLGLFAAAGLWLWRARRPGAGSAAALVDAEESARQLPLAADLLAACIAAGAGPVVAAQAVGEALGGPLGEVLARGAAEVRLGGEPAAAWRGVAAVPGAVPLARLLERADVSGLPAADPVARLAAQARADWGRAMTARARSAAVLVTAPVGLCFLPAFIAVGVLPVVLGLAGGVLGGDGGGG
ncbi:type II secretion system F family protein [Streptomyces sp. NPDC003717]|uniref:type II secretion system F family protein n=1 Tax=Streptomyces sp. NPDC003717 TaxID=3154276 RepID=UPI0033B24293